MSVFRSLASDFRITGDSLAGGTYAAARSTGNYSISGDALRIGQSYSSTHYYVYRSYVVFDTSAIPDGDTVTAVSLGLRVSSKFGTLATIYIYQYNWKTVPDSYTPSDDRDKVYDMGTDGATDGLAAVKETPEVDCTGLAVGDWAIFNGLSTAWINKTGNTKYAFRAARDADGAGTAPTSAEYYNFSSGDDGTITYRPYLDVTHGAYTGSRVTRLYATGVVCDNPLNQLS